MSYYDDWVDPNAFFPSALEEARYRRIEARWSREEREERGKREGRECPHCGIWRVGLEDHIKAKHPEEWSENLGKLK